MEINTIIADDEDGMRLVLKKALIKHKKLKVVAEVENGEEALDIVKKGDVQVAFLDIDMPLLNGIEAAKNILDVNPKCVIVFITAHNQFMQDAFQMYAFDYIIKPFKVDRLNKTVDKIVNYIENLDLKNETNHYYNTKERFLLKINDGMAVVKPEEIIMIERVNRSTVVVCDNGEYHTNLTLNEFIENLPCNDFLRSHKSYIINISKIEKIEIYGRWTYIIKFKNIKKSALMTKDKARELEEKVCML